MSEQIQLFKFEQNNVRILNINNGPWFVGKDVAGILGYGNSRQALKVHVDEEDKGVTKCDTPGGKQSLTIINESGMYSLILSSKLPTAKKFKHWVTGEVLPQIRKKGAYATDSKKIEILEENAKTRKAELLYKIANKTKSKKLFYKAAELITGEKVKPEEDKNYHTSSELAEMFETTAPRIDHIADTLSLKNRDVFGKWVINKTGYPEWLYTKKAIEKIDQYGFFIK